MSELTTCNYCTLKGMKARAKKMNTRIVVAPGKASWGGFDIHELKKKNDKPHDKNFRCWFMGLTDSCVCGGMYVKTVNVLDVGP